MVWVGGTILLLTGGILLAVGAWGPGVKSILFAMGILALGAIGSPEDSPDLRLRDIPTFVLDREQSTRTRLLVGVANACFLAVIVTVTIRIIR
jgi:hypothetical protein